MAESSNNNTNNLASDIKAGFRGLGDYEELSGYVVTGLSCAVLVVILLLLTFCLDKGCNTKILDNYSYKKNKTWLYYLIKYFRVLTHTKYILAETGREIPITELTRIRKNTTVIQLNALSSSVNS